MSSTIRRLFSLNAKTGMYMYCVPEDIAIEVEDNSVKKKDLTDTTSYFLKDTEEYSK